MGKILVKTQFDYADEFDVYGFVIYDSMEKLNEDIKKLEEYLAENDEWTRYFGSNEEIIIESVEEWKSGITVIKITDEEAKFLKKHFGNYYGIPIMPEDLD